MAIRIKHQPRNDRRSIAGQNGFTLIELLVVCILIAIMLAVSVPAFRNTLFTDPLRQAARKITGTIREARLAADGTWDGCNLEIDVSEKRIGYQCPEPPEEDADIVKEEESVRSIQLPEGVRFYSIWSGEKQNITAGKVVLWISNKGLMDRAIINIADDHNEMALITSVFLSEIRIEDSAMTFEDVEQ